MRLSAIIPTHARPDSLRACLKTLCAQEIEPERLEIVVVDDGSPEDIAGLVAEIGRDSELAIRCECQPLGGLNAARNRGAAVANGEVLGFLDDDTLVSPGWARAMLGAFERHPCAGVGGKVELDVTRPLPAWLIARRYYLAEYELGPEAHWLDGDPVPVGANCAVRRTDFERLGGFRTGLDRRAGSLVSNGDTEFFRRLRAAGGRLRYEPGAHVIHCVAPRRLTVEFFLERERSQGVSDELMYSLEQPLPRSRQLARLGHELAHEIRPMTETVARDLLRGRGTVNGRLFASYWRGRLSAVGNRSL
jgi:GT2 family glycosyltransferase